MAVYKEISNALQGRPPITVTANLTLDPEQHAGRIVIVNKADGAAITLPNATGTGHVYTILIDTTISSNSTTIKVAPSTDEEMRGVLLGRDTDAEGATGYTWGADDNDDTITLNGAATGGKKGDKIILTDAATGQWDVEGFIQQSGGSEATPFSATVSS